MNSSIEGTSILTKPVINTWLQIAQRNLEQDGFLVPVCLIRLASDQGIAVDLKAVMAAPTHEQKRMQLILLGNQIRAKGQDIAEAVMILETWYVRAKADQALTVAPSQQPNRQEAVVLIGRNAGPTRSSFLVQPFTRDKQEKPIWGKLAQAVYNASSDTGIQPRGLVDYLFVLPPTG